MIGLLTSTVACWEWQKVEDRGRMPSERTPLDHHTCKNKHCQKKEHILSVDSVQHPDYGLPHFWTEQELGAKKLIHSRLNELSVMQLMRGAGWNMRGKLFNSSDNSGTWPTLWKGRVVPVISKKKKFNMQWGIFFFIKSIWDLFKDTT